MDDNLLTIENGNTVVLNYDDISATNELITGATLNGTDLEITEAGETTTVDLSSLENIPFIGFKAEKNSENSLPDIGTDTTIVFDENIEYNSSNSYDASTGIFTAPIEGIYIFHLNFTSSNDGGEGRTLKLFKENNLYEILKNKISSNEIVTFSIPIRLNSGEEIKIVLNSGTSTNCGTGSFSGFRIH